MSLMMYLGADAAMHEPDYSSVELRVWRAYVDGGAVGDSIITFDNMYGTVTGRMGGTPMRVSQRPKSGRRNGPDGGTALYEADLRIRNSDVVSDAVLFGYIQGWNDTKLGRGPCSTDALYRFRAGARV